MLIPWPCPLPSFPTTTTLHHQDVLSLGYKFSKWLSSTASGRYTTNWALHHWLLTSPNLQLKNKITNQPWSAPKDFLNWQRSGKGWHHLGGRGWLQQPKKMKSVAPLQRSRDTASCTQPMGGASRYHWCISARWSFGFPNDGNIALHCDAQVM